MGAIESVKKCLHDAEIDKSKIGDIVLVSGSTCIPMLQKLLQELFNDKPLNRSINSDECVAYGAAVQAAILCGKESEMLQNVSLLDIYHSIFSGY